MPCHRAPLTLPLLFLIFLAAFALTGCTGLTTAGMGAPKSNSTSASTSSLTTSATHLSFGNVDLGQNSAQTVTITNTGTSSVTIANVSISGAGYAASGVPAGEILAPGKTVTLDVTFTPSAAGTLAGSVTLMSNATNSPATVSLNGAGVQASATAHSVTLTWTETTTSVLGYNVYRSTDAGAVYAKVNSSLITTTRYHDPSVRSGQTYFYAATTVDSSDVESAFSQPVSVTVPTP
jgi:hypothetical protein